MRTLNRTGIVLLLVAGFAAVAPISSTPCCAEGTGSDWDLQVQGSTTSYAYTAAVQIGSLTGASDDLDVWDVPWYGSEDFVPCALSYEPSFAGDTKYIGDYKDALTGTNQKSWNVIVYVGTAYTSASLRVSLWADVSIAPPASVDGHNYEYIVTILRDPTGSYPVGTSWSYPAGASGSPTSPVLHIDFGNASVLKTDDPDLAASTKGISLSVAARPAAGGGHVISGDITVLGDPLAGVTVAGTGVTAVQTDTDGHYALTVPDGWSGTVTPSLTGYAFTPPSSTYTSVTTDQSQNYTAVAMCSISGGVLKTGTPLEGVTLTANNGGGTATTDGSGFYTLWVPSGWTGNVTPSKAGYTFVPTSRAYTVPVTTNKVGQNFTWNQSPVISGTVLTGTGTPIVGVTLTATGAGSTTTNSSGAYSLPVPNNWSGTLTPGLAGFTFTPPYATFTAVVSSRTQDFTGSLKPVVSGIVLLDGVGLPGVTVTAGGGVGTGRTDASGGYSIAVPSGWSGTLTPSLTHYGFSPVSLSLTNVTANTGGHDFSAYQTEVMISGWLRTAEYSQFFAGQTVTASGVGSVASDGGGHYEIWVPHGWSGTVTPAPLVGWTINPTYWTYGNVVGNMTADYIYTAWPSISGRVTDTSGVGIGGVDVRALDNGGRETSDTTDANGDYSVPICPGAGCQVTPTKSGHAFNPASREYSIVSTSLTGQNFVGGTGSTISGMVRDQDGVPLSGVQFRINEWQHPSDYTYYTNNSDGTYSIPVPFGSNIVMLVSRDHYDFQGYAVWALPDYFEFENVTAPVSLDLTGQRLVYISGSFYDMSGSALIVNAMEVSWPMYTVGAAVGADHYSFSVPYGWSGYVQPKQLGRAFIVKHYENLTTDITGQDFHEVDATPPAVTISAPSTPLARGGPVTYTVSYTDAVGVGEITLSAANVTLNKTGTANGTVTVEGTGLESRTVTISGITGDGTLGISIAAETARDVANMYVGGYYTSPIFASAAGPSTTFIVDNTPPTMSVGEPSHTLTNHGPVSYTLTYGGASGITLSHSDVTLVRTGTADATVSVGVLDDVWSVVVDNVTGDGTLGISIASGTAHDQAGNLAPSGTGTAFAVDNTRPNVSIAGPSVELTTGSPVTYTVTYSDETALAGISLTSAKVDLNRAGTANGTVSVEDAGANARTVVISGITGEGTLGISLWPGTATDTAGNTALEAGPTSTFQVDTIAPTIEISSPSESVTKAGPVSYTVTYSGESAITLAQGNVSLEKTGTADGTVSVSFVDAHTRLVTISGATGTGTLRISIAAGTASDAAGNSAPAAGYSAPFVVDNAGPAITSIEFYVVIASDHRLIACGDTVTVSAEISDAVPVASVTMPGCLLTNTSGNTWTGTFAAAPAPGSNPLTFTTTDALGNVANPSAAYTTVPTVALTSLSAAYDPVMTAAHANYVFDLPHSGGSYSPTDAQWMFSDTHGHSLTVWMPPQGWGMTDPRQPLAVIVRGEFSAAGFYAHSVRYLYE